MALNEMSMNPRMTDEDEASQSVSQSQVSCFDVVHFVCFHEQNGRGLGQGREYLVIIIVI